MNINSFQIILIFFNKLYSDFHNKILKDKIEKVLNKYDIYKFEQIESLFNYISCNKKY